MNLARSYVERSDRTLKEWWGCCHHLTESVLEEAGRGQILYVHLENLKERLQGIGDSEWSRHYAPVIDGLVHDAWLDSEPLPVSAYLERAFDGQTVLYMLIEHS